MTNLSASLEDYLEVIYNLLESSPSARSKDIAKKLNVAKPSVTGALKILAEKGLVNYKPYGVVTLTEIGKKNAAAIVKKHDVVSDFLTQVLGIEKNSAQQAACLIEHNLGTEITTRLKKFNEFTKFTKIDNYNINQLFKEFYEKESSSK